MEPVRSRKTGIFAIATWTLIVGFSACTGGGPAVHFIVPVDEITAPDTVAQGDTLTVRFSGTIGPDLCSRLERVERHRAPGLLELTFHGERPDGGNCLQMPAALDYVEKVAPPLEDSLTIRVLQPDGGRLEKVVRAK